MGNGGTKKGRCFLRGIGAPLRYSKWFLRGMGGLLRDSEWFLRVVCEGFNVQLVIGTVGGWGERVTFDGDSGGI